jgi:4-hydroxy-tetrahydrodipicolinate reductase
VKIWISGAAGHMGQAVAQLAAEQGVTVLGGIDMRDVPGMTVHRGFDSLPETGDAVIDFSAPAALDGLLAWAVKNGVPCVLATTGYTEAQLAAIGEAAKAIPVFRSANMSVGIALLQKLAREAAAALGESFDIEIVEAHHRRKKDAPSGTALMLYDAVKDAREKASPAVFGREGRDCPRQPGEIGVHAVRGGTVTGEHRVLFLGDMERIVLSHSAENRAVFAAGALRAAAFLQGRAPGIYDMTALLDAAAG